MPVYHHREKLLNAIIYFANHTKYCGKTKLYKLLYYFDFNHFKETGRSVTELEYYAWDYGPAPSQLHNELQNPPQDIRDHITLIGMADSFQGVKAKKHFDRKHFTKREMRLLEQIAQIFRDAKAEDMVEASHEDDKPWDITKKTKGMYKPIDYLLALDNSAKSITLEEAKEHIKDRTQLESAFK
jgi:uncharacterized phage-associated protein